MVNGSWIMVNGVWLFKEFHARSQRFLFLAYFARFALKKMTKHWLALDFEKTE